MLKNKDMRWLLWFVMPFITLVLCTCTNEKYTRFHQGYVEGQVTYISSNVSGVLEILYVKRGDNVKKNDPLFLLEPQPESNQLQKIEANVASAKMDRDKILAALELSKLTFNRQSELLKRGSTTRESFDKTRLQFEQDQKALASAEENIKSLEAELANVKWTVSNKTVNASKSATVFDTYYLTGEYISASKPVLALLTPEDVKIVFFLPETSLGKIRIGQEIFIKCDNCESEVKATINFISPKAEFTPPIIYSENERAKLVFRIEAVPAPNDVKKIHPGQPVEIKIIY